VHRPVVRVVTSADGGLLTPGFLADLAQRDEQNNFPAPSSKSRPVKYGLKVSDYFV